MPEIYTSGCIECWKLQYRLSPASTDLSHLTQKPFLVMYKWCRIAVSKSAYCPFEEIGVFFECECVCRRVNSFYLSKACTKPYENGLDVSMFTVCQILHRPWMRMQTEFSIGVECLNFNQKVNAPWQLTIIFSNIASEKKFWREKQWSASAYIREHTAHIIQRHQSIKSCITDFCFSLIIQITHLCDTAIVTSIWNRRLPRIK